MDRLSFLINQNNKLSTQLQSALQQPVPASDSDKEDGLDEYFKQYDNPTTKSIPVSEDQLDREQCRKQKEHQLPNFQNQHRTRLAFKDCSVVEENSNDQSTIVIGYSQAQSKNFLQKMHKVKYVLQRDSMESTHPATRPQLDDQNNPQIPIYGNQNFQKRKIGKAQQEQNSLPIQNKHSIHLKNKENQEGKLHKKVDRLRPLSDLRYAEQKTNPSNKIPKQEFARILQKNYLKKSESSTNRKPATKRQPLINKSLTQLGKNRQIGYSANFLSNKSVGNTSSCKHLGSKKNYLSRADKTLKQAPARNVIPSNQKGVKKLNRVNICKLQQTLKKGQQKKTVAYTSSNHGDKANQNHNGQQKSSNKNKAINNGIFRGREQLKLSFVGDDHASNMKKLISLKTCEKDYERATMRFEQVCLKISGQYLQGLVDQVRQTSEQAILKIRILCAIFSFFEQFSVEGLAVKRSSKKIDNSTESQQQLFTEDQIIDVLRKPRHFLELIVKFPIRLLEVNVLAQRPTKQFLQEFDRISEQLDQELQFFLIKKTTLFSLLHQLAEYLQFLIFNQLVDKTSRNKITLPEGHFVQGYYSSRSKRQNIGKQKQKRRVIPIGFRCDSDRKITLQDEQAQTFTNTKRAQPKSLNRRTQREA